jgi:hypothetical protein
MKQHTVIAHRIFRSVEARLGPNFFLRIADELAHFHHERRDGKGYPAGLKAEAIPLAGRIMALVDVYDALVNQRVYKPPLTHDEAVAEIRASRGQHFDPEVVEASSRSRPSSGGSAPGTPMPPLRRPVPRPLRSIVQTVPNADPEPREDRCRPRTGVEHPRSEHAAREARSLRRGGVRLGALE